MKKTKIHDLTSEIKLRVLLSEAFDGFITRLSSRPRADGGFSAELALLLAQTIELRKGAEKEERFLKSLILESGLRVLDYDSLVITVTDRSRTDLDREALTAHFGPEAIAPFIKETQFKMINLVRKV